VSTDIIETSHQLVSRGQPSPSELAFQTQTLMEIYRRIMQKDTDYGVIPGTPKPTLYQPGAQILRLAAGYGVEMEHTETDRNLAIGWISHSFTCRLTNADGMVVGICEGSANSYEDRYRWRWLSERDLPKGIDKDSLVSKKRTGKFNEYHVYRVENENPAGLDNTLVKIAQKRAFVGAVLMATGASRIFTQDVEDAVEDDGVSPEVEAQRPGPRKAKGKPEPKPDKPNTGLSTEPKSATPDQQAQVGEHMKSAQGSVLGIIQQRGWQLGTVGDLSQQQADIIIRLMNGEAVD
jgi:hypothetical protein